MKSLKVAVIGVGHLGRVHAKALSKLPGVRLVGVVDINEQQRQTVAEACRTNAFADHLAVADKIDAAVIATTTQHHHEVALALVQRGIPVLVEKPLAVNSRQAEELVRAASGQNLVLQTGHIERFNPAVAPALPFAKQPKWIEARRMSGFTCRATDVGVVLDLMIHDIDLALAFTGERPSHVEAMGLSLFGKHEDVCQAQLRFPSGCLAQLTASRISFEAARRMQVWSENGFASIDFASRSATTVRPQDSVYDRELQIETATSRERDDLKDRLFEKYLVKETVTPEPADQITAELVDFTTAIREGRAPLVDGKAGMAAIAVAEEILQSVAEHNWDGTASGRRGPQAEPLPAVLPGPHFALGTGERSPRASIVNRARPTDSDRS